MSNMFVKLHFTNYKLYFSDALIMGDEIILDNRIVLSHEIVMGRCDSVTMIRVTKCRSGNETVF